MLHEESCIPDLHKDLEARWRELAETAINRRDLVLSRAERRHRWTALARRSIAFARDRQAGKLPFHTLTRFLGEATGIHGVRFLKRLLARIIRLRR